MEKENMFVNEGKNSTIPYGMNRNNEMNCSFLNPNWENSMDQTSSDPFESALSSMVSSPTASNPNGDNNIVLRELIGRLGSICNSGGEISSYTINAGNNNNNSSNTSCYSTPLNSPPISGNMQIPGGTHFPSSLSNLVAPFPTDPGFAERAARFSCFANKSLMGGLSSQLGFNEMPSGKISGSHPMDERISVSDKKFSTSSTPENVEFGDSRENSSVSGEIGMMNDSNSRKRKSIPKGKVGSENSESSAKRSKSEDDSPNEKDASKKTKADKQSKDNSKPPEPPKDYIHVRARRGQATDAHSLAERVRREKISERMKVLQDLVPGCNKVTGKAVMLDEIINYVQSLQRQVEFLSMKLATVNPRMDFNMEALMSKDLICELQMFQCGRPLPHNIYPSDSYPFQPQTNLPNGTEANFPANNFNAADALGGRNQSMQLPPMDNLNETASQVSTFWEDDLHSVVQMGFGQNQTQNFHGILPTAQMKVEL